MTGNNRLKDVNNMSKDAIELDNQFAKSALKSVKSGQSIPKSPSQRRRDSTQTQSLARSGTQTDFGDPQLLRKDSDLSNLLMMSQVSDKVKLHKVKMPSDQMSKKSSSSSSKYSKKTNMTGAFNKKSKAKEPENVKNIMMSPAKTIRDLEKNDIQIVKVEKATSQSKQSIKIMNSKSKSKSKSGSKSKNEIEPEVYDDTMTDIQSETHSNFFNQNLKDSKGKIRLRSATKNSEKMSSTTKNKSNIQRRKQQRKTIEPKSIRVFKEDKANFTTPNKQFSKNNTRLETFANFDKILPKSDQKASKRRKNSNNIDKSSMKIKSSKKDNMMVLNINQNNSDFERDNDMQQNTDRGDKKQRNSEFNSPHPTNQKPKFKKKKGKRKTQMMKNLNKGDRSFKQRRKSLTNFNKGGLFMEDNLHFSQSKLQNSMFYENNTDLLSEQRGLYDSKIENQLKKDDKKTRPPKKSVKNM